MTTTYAQAAEQARLAMIAVTAWADLLGDRGGPRYRYFEVKAKGRSRRTFEWTTETANGGKYWAVERRWVTVKNGQQGKIVRKVGFAQRQKAKARALAWYQKAKVT